MDYVGVNNAKFSDWVGNSENALKMKTKFLFC